MNLLLDLKNTCLYFFEGRFLLELLSDDTPPDTAPPTPHLCDPSSPQANMVTWRNCGRFRLIFSLPSFSKAWNVRNMVSRRTRQHT